MKFSHLRKCFSLVLLLACASMIEGSADLRADVNRGAQLKGQGGGQGTGNGGDAVAMEFYAIVQVIAASLRNDPLVRDKFSEIDPTLLMAKADSVIVRSTSETLRDQLGNEKTVINYSEGGKEYIKVRKSEYNALGTLSRQRLVLHEYLGQMGLEKSDDYRISSRLQVEFSRPSYGTCETYNQKGMKCTIAMRFDTGTRSLEGAYSCRAYRNRKEETDILSGDLYTTGELNSKNAEWKAVKVWPKAGAVTAGFSYQDNRLQFDVASSPSTQLKLPFTLRRRTAGLNQPDNMEYSTGYCTFVYH